VSLIPGSADDSFALHRRNNWFVRSLTDLLLGGFFIAASIVAAFFCTKL
jgi:hypothetical protein